LQTLSHGMTRMILFHKAATKDECRHFIRSDKSGLFPTSALRCIWSFSRDELATESRADARVKSFC
jgi:hypothetical protein